jgi:hypothetical protein
MKTPVFSDGNVYIFNCPQCGLYLEVEKSQVNCEIFRHGFFYNQTPYGIHLTSQMNPHASKNECDFLVRENKIIGCGKPFRMIKEADEYSVVECEYL